MGSDARWWTGCITAAAASSCSAGCDRLPWPGAYPSFTTGGVNVGADYRVSEHFVLGAALAIGGIAIAYVVVRTNLPGRGILDALAMLPLAVPGLVPDEVFFDHLANRRFPAGQFIRKPDQLDYLREPDIFHDVFGHVPMLTDPVFADYMQAYGRGGQRAMELGQLHNLARLYWYTVEFGLIREEGLAPGDVAVVLRAPEDHAALLQDVFATAGCEGCC